MSQPSALDLVRQRRFGHYEITEKLGAGGMGEVYRARDLTLGRAVAIKVLRGSTSKDPDRLARFEQEARSASALNHPNIVTIHEIGSVDGIRYIAMELVEGKTLRQLLLEGPLMTRRALQLAAQAAGGLAEAHDAGIVHRDLKPENIMVTRDGRVKILDFGLAKLVGPVDEDAITESGEAHETEPGRILGTVRYMSPEQAEGRPLDFRSDQFSCGAILYEMATGRPAFQYLTRTQTLSAIAEVDPPRISTLNPAVPPPLRWIIERCLAKDPAERYGSTRDMARDLENVLVHLAEVSPASPPGAERFGPARRRRTRALLAAGLVVVVMCGIGVAAWIARSRHSANTSAGTEEARTSIPARRSVAVLGFKNLSRSSEANWLSIALADMLTTELAAGGRLRTIPGENVGRMKMELSLSDAESLARDTLAKVGKNLGTDTVLLGSYLTLPEDQIRLDLRLQDVAAGETVAALAESGTETKLVDLVTRAGSRLRQSMGVEEPSAAEVHALAAGAPSNLEAQRLYAEGLAKLRVLDALTARDLLKRAVAADSNSSMAHSALADAWTMLGYDAKAKTEAERAFDLSRGLSREERFLVEARYREMAGEWDKAIGIYGGLLAFFPDNVEYGLRLATAQSTRGKGEEALVTLAKLRSLARPGSDDPRIDLTEAIVAQSLGDFKRGQAAANRAATKGQSMGARLLVARARLREAYALDWLGEVAKGAVVAEEARKIYADAGDRGGLARALDIIGSLARYHGDLETAKAKWEEALTIRRQIGYRRGVGVSLHNLGLVLWQRGALTGAWKNMEESTTIGRELGDKTKTAMDLADAVGLLHDQGRLTEAKKTGEEALALAREIGAQSEATFARLGLATVLQTEGDLGAAEANYRQGLLVLRERGLRESIADTLFQLGELLQAKGDLAAARKSQEEALAIRNEMKATFAIAKSQTALADLFIEEGYPEAAEPLARSASTVFAAQKAPDWEATAQAVLGRSLLARQKVEDAQRAVEAATTLTGPTQNPHVRLAVAVSAARVLAANGMTADAQRSLEKTLAEGIKLGLVGLQFDTRLAQGEIGIGSGTGSAGGSLAALARDARARGFGLVARKAESMLQSAERRSTS
jgi:tetratricopeptide (TPR) repeat protein